mgnify:CR=1 FL=1
MLLRHSRCRNRQASVVLDRLLRRVAASLAPAVCLVGAVLGAASTTDAALSEQQVLLVYNSQNADSQSVRDHYKSIHPNVHEFDLNDALLNPGTVSYSDYVDKVRTPIRDHLANEGLSEDIAAMTLTMGIPHRIEDTDDAAVGDTPNAALTEFDDERDATFASVDSELTLLWQDLDSGESGGNMDSLSDNWIVNPYRGSTQSVNNFDRASITQSAAFVQLGDQWTMPSADAGDIYLVTRLDGHTVDQVKSSIDRAQDIEFNRNLDAIVLDEDGDNDFDNSSLFGDDYTKAQDLLAADWSPGRLIHEQTSDFVTDDVAGPIALLASYGSNHVNGNTTYTDDLAGQFVDGAIFNTYESFNGRVLGGVTGDKGQEQIADFIANGGTLGFGHVWEPFANSVARNEWFVQNFLLGDLSWAEAAYTAIPYLSWQQIVIGDPLATVTLVPEPSTAALVMLPAAALLARRRGPAA